MGRYHTGRREVDETVSQLHKIGELLDAYKGGLTDAIGVFATWLEGGNPYPHDPYCNSKTRLEQASSVIEWLEDEIRRENGG